MSENNFKSILNRCDAKTARILKCYVRFMYEAIDRLNFGLKEEFIPFNIHTKKNLENLREISIYYLFLYGYDYNNFVKRNPAIKTPQPLSYDDYQYINGRVDEEDNMDYLEKAFNENLSWASNLIETYSPPKGTICIERILVNIIKKASGDTENIKDALKFNIMLPILQDIADKKELSNSKSNHKHQASSSVSSSDLPSDFKEIPKKTNQPPREEIKSVTEQIKPAQKQTPVSKPTINPISIKYGENLTTRNYSYNPLIGRNKEFRRMCALLMDEEKSLIIHGNPGVGKTALVNGLAYKIQNGISPKPLKDKQVIEISASEMVSGCQFVGMVEERLLDIINSLIQYEDAILFIDEIHTLMGLGKGKDAVNDISNILKPYLGDGRLKIIGATTTEEYQTILENGAFARRFNSLEVPELSDNDVIEILKFTVDRYKKTKGIDIKYQEEIMLRLLKLILTFSKKNRTNMLLGQTLYNPDLALTMLRNGYNFAMLDGKDALDAASIIEGVDSMHYFGKTAKEEFERNVLRLTREKPTLYILPSKKD